ncbi:hypothetical protein EYF80_049415 [Liparis tanakae]|uniref:Uncharacterized protein n=1 Tax=Liparis tanakae TaxID=230148 RepID=A0A4Z2FGW4_9TELE|nr:hypothetical protein EYF80_049415 [Liparis tanakae]
MALEELLDPRARRPRDPQGYQEGSGRWALRLGARSSEIGARRSELVARSSELGDRSSELGDRSSESLRLMDGCSSVNRRRMVLPGPRSKGQDLRAPKASSLVLTGGGQMSHRR